MIRPSWAGAAGARELLRLGGDLDRELVSARREFPRECVGGIAAPLPSAAASPSVPGPIGRRQRPRRREATRALRAHEEGAMT